MNIVMTEPYFTWLVGSLLIIGLVYSVMWLARIVWMLINVVYLVIAIISYVLYCLLYLNHRSILKNLKNAIFQNHPFVTGNLNFFGLKTQNTFIFDTYTLHSLWTPFRWSTSITYK